MFARTRIASLVLVLVGWLGPAAVDAAPHGGGGTGPRGAGTAPVGGCATNLRAPDAPVAAARVELAVRAPERAGAVERAAPAQVATAPAAPAQPSAGPGDDDWRPIASLTVHHLVAAGAHVAVRVDPANGRLEAIAPPDGLTESARWAVAYAPDWLGDELADGLARLAPERQDEYARLLLNASDPIVDEVAFQIAHLGSATLTNRFFSPDLIVRNAQLMYEHDKVLQFVDIVDHGAAARGGDYYSATLYFYRGADGGVRWIEVPRDVYYWYVVHPRLSDETVKASGEASMRQATYGYFWREFLFSNPDAAHDYSLPRGDGPRYPVLGDVLRVPTVLWDGRTVNLDGSRPFAASDTALDVLGHWVSSILPDKASGNRPVQPNQIAYEHNGNCGEIQDLLGAASRTALVPNVLISDHCEDHVWNEVYAMLPTEGWLPYQVDWDGGPTRINVSGVAYDRDVGGGKDVSAIWAWRPDGLSIGVVDRYSKSCTLAVEVKDAGGAPVDGAQVTVYSEAWQSTDFVVATFATTDAAGRATFRLGDNQNYALRVTSALGSYPPDSAGPAQVIAASAADGTYVKEVRLAGSLRGYRYSVRPSPGSDRRIAVRFTVPGEYAYGASPFADGALYAARHEPGSLDVFALSERDYALYGGASAFEAFTATVDTASGAIDVPLATTSGTAYVIFAADDHVSNAQVLDAEVALLGPAPTSTATPPPTPKPVGRIFMPCVSLYGVR